MLDSYFVKYLATVVALVVYALPIYMQPAGQKAGSGELAQDYIRAMRLLQNTSRWAGLAKGAWQREGRAVLSTVIRSYSQRRGCNRCC